MLEQESLYKTLADMCGEEGRRLPALHTQKNSMGRQLIWTTGVVHKAGTLLPQASGLGTYRGWAHVLQPNSAPWNKLDALPG